MRIIFSRKGVDKAAGGIASPILDGSLVSLPVPGSSQITYNDLKFENIRLGTLAKDLSNGRLHKNFQTHLDPDLREATYPRKPCWRPIYGQGTPAAKSHLQRHGVTVGDLFLFFGWFRDAELGSDGKYRYKRGAPNLHVIFGWLQIGAVLSCEVPRLSDIAWARYHPHASDRDCLAYVSCKNLHLGRPLNGIPGAGCFPRYHEFLRLTAPDSAKRSVWRLPSWFRPHDGCRPLTGHPRKSVFKRHGNYTYVESTRRGQEFVLDTDEYPKAETWARRLIEKGLSAAR